MPPELKKRVEKAARDAGRSLNAEICQRLEQSFASDSAGEQSDLAGRMQELEQRVAALEHVISDLRRDRS